MGKIAFDEDNDSIIAAIQDAVRTETIKVEKDEFLTRPVHLAPNKPFADRFDVKSLSGLADYINEKIDGGVTGPMVIEVVSPTEVHLVSQVDDREDRRFTSVVAKADVPNIGVLNNWTTQEVAMIEMQALFVQEGRVIDVLKDIGSIVLEDEVGLDDDGVTQKVTTRSGIERAVAAIENPVCLKPFRTFSEIDQPSSPFVLRLKKDGNNNLFIALYEADGGKWRNEARRSIKEYLASETNGAVPILA